MQVLSVEPRPRVPSHPTWWSNVGPSGSQAKGSEIPVDFERFLASLSDLPRSRCEPLSHWWSREEPQ